MCPIVSLDPRWHSAKGKIDSTTIICFCIFVFLFFYFFIFLFFYFCIFAFLYLYFCFFILYFVFCKGKGKLDSTTFICICIFVFVYSRWHSAKGKIDSTALICTLSYLIIPGPAASFSQETLQQFERSLNSCFEQLSKKRLDALQWPKFFKVFMTSGFCPSKENRKGTNCVN